ncbi:hypothetical protein DFH07DRAFT_494262 [Mycena maculata]|uniref:Uncharacterized protein n=1 Tax=Mycena maculata TaxID=230809 RepID=A0AAD7J210_9AGAR|nr:hypothetical protein DFH07DRAFT_494262 [Mycena maculata]
MKKVALAVEALKKASVKHKNGKIQDRIDHLNTVLTLLNLCTKKALRQLCDIFKQNHLAPLFPAFPALMFRFCAAILDAVFRDKVQPANQARDFAVQYSWEMVQKAVVGSVFEFLEDPKYTSNLKSNKTAAANELYSTLCAMCFPREAPFEWKNRTLVVNMNMLLSDIATEHPENQTRLRGEKLLGAKQLGLALAQSKGNIVVLIRELPLSCSHQITSSSILFWSSSGRSSLAVSPHGSAPSLWTAFSRPICSPAAPRSRASSPRPPTQCGIRSQPR